MYCIEHTKKTDDFALFPRQTILILGS